MAYQQPQAAPARRVLIENVGLMLSGDLARPILDASAILVEDGLVRAVGRAADMP